MIDVPWPDALDDLGYRGDLALEYELADPPPEEGLRLGARGCAAHRLVAGASVMVGVPAVMSSRRRFLAAILGGRVDRPAVGSPTSVATVEQMEATGASFPEVHLHGRAMARLAAGACDILGYDAIMPVFSVVQEAAALGCPVDWGALDTMPTVQAPSLTEPDQVRLPADPLERPPLRAVLDAIRMLRGEYGHRVAIIGKGDGPWTLAYHVYGLQEFLSDTLLAPERVRGFLDALSGRSAGLRTRADAAGADLCASPTTPRAIWCARACTGTCCCPSIAASCASWAVLRCYTSARIP